MTGARRRQMAQGPYFLARMSDLVTVSGAGAVQIQIALDMDGLIGSGDGVVG